MDKIGKPRDLIGYLALTDETRERAGQTPKSVWSHVFRVRTILYTVLWSAVGLGLVVALFLRSPIDMNVTPVRNPTFVTLSDGGVRNAYDIRLRNMHGEDAQFTITVTSDAIVTLALEGVDGPTVTVPANETMSQRVYLTAAPGSPAAVEDRTDVRLWVEELGTTNRVHHDTLFNGKEDEDDDD
jgi:polyferredoxin